MKIRDETKRLQERGYYQKNREKLLDRKRRWWAGQYPKNKEKLLERRRQEKWAVKEEVLTHYGNGKHACIRCGFSDLRALSIDHIEGGGTAHTQGLKKAGNSFYRWLIKNNYPVGYQTLCMNCQFIKRVENKECPK